MIYEIFKNVGLGLKLGLLLIRPRAREAACCHEQWGHNVCVYKVCHVK